MNEPLLTFRQAAKALGVDKATVGDLVHALGIPRRRHPVNGRAYGLTPGEMRKLRKVLNQPEPISAA